MDRGETVEIIKRRTDWFLVRDPFLNDGWRFIDRGSINFSIDLLTVDYHEFRDLTSGALVGEEPYYSLDANIVQMFFSFWY